ncbi:MAG: hypothetical protein ACREAA_02450 [Candidatus Polarisedimenticolia bacterium]
MSQEIDWDRVIEELEAKRALIDTTIAGIRALRGLPGQMPLAGVPDMTGVGALPMDQPRRAAADLPSEVAPGVFHGLSIAQACKKLFRMLKTKQRTPDICRALQAGGIESSAKNFYSNVYTTLARDKDFINLGGSWWALAEWYPNRQPTVRPKAKKKVRASKKAAEKKTAAKKGETVEKASIVAVPTDKAAAS